MPKPTPSGSQPNLHSLQSVKATKCRENVKKNWSKLPAEFYLFYDELKADALAEEYSWDAPVVEARVEEPPCDELKAEAFTTGSRTFHSLHVEFEPLQKLPP
jgi:hypothetical protein